MTYKEKSVGMCEKAFAFLKTWTDAAACPSSSQFPLPPVPPTPTCIWGCDSPGPGGQQVHGLRVEGREKMPGALVALLSRHSGSEQPASRTAGPERQIDACLCFLLPAMKVSLWIHLAHSLFFSLYSLPCSQMDALIQLPSPLSLSLPPSPLLSLFQQVLAS